MAQILKKEKAAIQKVLKWLSAKRIIEYEPQKDTPQIRFLYNRVVTDNLTINNHNYQERKKTLEGQVDAICSYIENTSDCRSQIIAGYFNDFKVKPCGICDNCIESKKKNALEKNDFVDLYAGIAMALQPGPLTISELLQQLKIADEKKLWKVINHLIAENKIEMSEQTKGGKVMIKKKGQDKNPARF